jgi:SAM-dependent methyltransferase
MGDATSQRAAFSGGEGDRFFQRNRDALAAYDIGADPVARCVMLAGLQPSSVLEVGAASGDRVAALVQALGAEGMAIDPSPAAVEEGRRRHPQVVFDVATMDDLPEIGPFALVIVNFVFHWIDRGLLLRSASEVDRMVADGGHLVIGDFMPSGLSRTPYHHQPGLWTFKQDYADLFVASGIYCRTLHMAGEYDGVLPSGAGDPAHRMAVSVLHKSLHDHYQTVRLDE